MENLLLLFATTLAWRISAPKFKRYIIGRTGCTSLLLSGETSLHIQSTKDNERVYFYEHKVNEVVYGLITINMKDNLAREKSEEILHQYVDRIQKPFGINCSAGTEIESNADTITLIDYWQDEEGIDWKIKGHSNGKIIAVLYVKNISEAPVKEHDAFLNGFRFSSVA
ncbi:MAG TPA: hypothetical protein VM871_02120 [Flavisolibacter sp.]|nr:hypothetical protein [Flavisolibacter sp.]